MRLNGFNFVKILLLYLSFNFSTLYFRLEFLNATFKPYKSFQNQGWQYKELLNKYFQACTLAESLKNQIDNLKNDLESSNSEKKELDSNLVRLKVVLDDKNKIHKVLVGHDQALQKSRDFFVCQSNLKDKQIRDLAAKLRQALIDRAYLNSQIRNNQQTINQVVVCSQQQISENKKNDLKLIEQMRKEICSEKIDYAHCLNLLEKKMHEINQLKLNVSEQAQVINSRNLLIQEQAEQINKLAEVVKLQERENEELRFKFEDLQSYVQELSNKRISENFEHQDETSYFKALAESYLSQIYELKNNKTDLELNLKDVENDFCCREKNLKDSYMQLSQVLESKSDSCDGLLKIKKELERKLEKCKAKKQKLFVENQNLKKVVNFELENNQKSYQEKLSSITDAHEQACKRVEFLEKNNKILSERLAKTDLVFQRAKNKYLEQLDDLKSKFQEHEELALLENDSQVRSEYSQRYNLISQNFKKLHDSLKDQAEFLEKKLYKNKNKIKEAKRYLRYNKAENVRLSQRCKELIEQSEYEDKKYSFNNQAMLVPLKDLFSQVSTLKNDFRDLRDSNSRALDNFMMRCNKKMEKERIAHNQEKAKFAKIFDRLSQDSFKAQGELERATKNLIFDDQDDLKNRLQSAQDELEIVKESLDMLHQESEKSELEKDGLCKKMQNLEEQVQLLSIDLNRAVFDSGRYKQKAKNWKKVAKEKDKTVKLANQVSHDFEDENRILRDMVLERENYLGYVDSQNQSLKAQLEKKTSGHDLVNFELVDKLKNEFNSYVKTNEKVKSDLKKETDFEFVTKYLDDLNLNFMLKNTFILNEKIQNKILDDNLFAKLILELTPDPDSLTHLLDKKAYKNKESVAQLNLQLQKSQEYKNIVLALKLFLARQSIDPQLQENAAVSSSWKNFSSDVASYFNNSDLKNLKLSKIEDVCAYMLGFNNPVV